MQITLSLAELMAVEDALGIEVLNGDPADPTTGRIDDGPAYRDLCLKVGSGLCEAFGNQREITLSFDADELWLLREHLLVYATSGADQEFGLRLKCKVYRALLDLANNQGEIGMDAPVDYLDPAFDRSDFERWMGGLGDANQNSPSNTN